MKTWLPHRIYVYTAGLFCQKKRFTQLTNNFMDEIHPPWPHHLFPEKCGKPTCNTETSLSLVELDLLLEASSRQFTKGTRKITSANTIIYVPQGWHGYQVERMVQLSSSMRCHPKSEWKKSVDKKNMKIYDNYNIITFTWILCEQHTADLSPAQYIFCNPLKYLYKCFWIVTFHTSIATPLSLFKLPRAHQKKKRGNSPVSSFREKKTRKIHSQIHAKPAYYCERSAGPPVPGGPRATLMDLHRSAGPQKMVHEWGNRSINLSCCIS